jgi:superkiller protein 3
VWFLKGFIPEAHRLVGRARTLLPNDENLDRVERRFVEKEREWEDRPQFYSITPLPPGWLQYVLTQTRSRNMREQIIALSENADPNDAVIQLEATISLLENEEYEAAARKAKAVVLPPPPSGPLWGNGYACAVACRALALAGEIDEAIRVGIRAVSLEQESKLAWGSLAIALSRQDEPDAAADRFMDAVEQRPMAASVFYYNVGLRKMEMGEIEEAAALFERSVESQPDNFDAQLSLGVALQNLGKSEQAVGVLQKAVAMKPSDPEAHAELGRALLSEGRYAESAAALGTAIQIDPKNAAYHNYLGLSLAGLDRRNESMQEYRRAAELDPRHVSPHYNLANSLAKTGDLPGAVTEYWKVIRIMPEHP